MKEQISFLQNGVPKNPYCCEEALMGDLRLPGHK